MIQTLIPLGLQVVEEVLQQELAPLPRPAREMALGLGNPVRYADLRPGEVVLDLGSGGGIDTLLERARAHAAMMGRENVEFLHGMMESIPLPEACVDVAISNGVINLSTRKGPVFAECFRVLRPGGRLVFADSVLNGSLPRAVPGLALRALQWGITHLHRAPAGDEAGRLARPGRTPGAA